MFSYSLVHEDTGERLLGFDVIQGYQVGTEVHQQHPGQCWQLGGR